MAQYRRYRFPLETLADWFSEGEHRKEHYRVISGGFPPDAKLVNARHSWPNAIELLIESSEFYAVAEPEEIPLVDITIQRVRE